MKSKIGNWINTWWLAVVAFALVFGLWWWWHEQVALKKAAEALDPGTFGDWFGSLNALFSGLAFAGLIVTLQIQRRELEQNTAALMAQEAQLAKQVAALERQLDLASRSAQLASIPLLIHQVQLQIANNPRRGFSAPVEAHTDDELIQRCAKISVEVQLLENTNKRKDYPRDVNGPNGASIVIFSVGNNDDSIRDLKRLDVALRELLKLRKELKHLYRSTRIPNRPSQPSEEASTVANSNAPEAPPADA